MIYPTIHSFSLNRDLTLSKSHIIYKIKYLPMLPKIIPFSVEATFTFAFILAKSWGARVRGDGFSTSFKSPN